MFNKKLTLVTLKQIHNATETLLERFSPITRVEDFTNTPQGMEKLDATCMLLIAIGESLKNIDKITESRLFANYPQVDWKKAKALRDIISHHYFDINAEAIFDVCDTKIKPLSDTIQLIINDLEK